MILRKCLMLIKRERVIDRIGSKARFGTVSNPAQNQSHPLYPAVTTIKKYNKLRHGNLKNQFV